MITDRLPTGPARGEVRALARFGGGKLVTSPWFLSGLAIAALGTAGFVAAVLTDRTATWDDDGWVVAVGFIILAILTMVAVNRAALRDRHEGTVEQHEALPVGIGTRISGLLGATAWPAVLSTVLLAVVVSYASFQVGVPSITILDLLHYAALVMMLGAVGLALAAWLPNSFVAPVLAFVLLMVLPGENPPIWFEAIWHFEAGPAGWRIAYLLGLTVVLAAVAQAKWRFSRSQVLALVVGAILVVASLLAII